LGRDILSGIFWTVIIGFKLLRRVQIKCSLGLHFGFLNCFWRWVAILTQHLTYKRRYCFVLSVSFWLNLNCLMRLHPVHLHVLMLGILLCVVVKRWRKWNRAFILDEIASHSYRLLLFRISGPVWIYFFLKASIRSRIWWIRWRLQTCRRNKASQIALWNDHLWVPIPILGSLWWWPGVGVLVKGGHLRLRQERFRLDTRHFEGLIHPWGVKSAFNLHPVTLHISLKSRVWDRPSSGSVELTFHVILINACDFWAPIIFLGLHQVVLLLYSLREHSAHYLWLLLFFNNPCFFSFFFFLVKIFFVAGGRIFKMKIVNFQSVWINYSQLCVATSGLAELVLVYNWAGSRVACKALSLLLGLLLLLLIVEVELFLPDLAQSVHT
jgi:hypothetical protein